MLANTIHAYPVLLMGGWPGIVLSMAVEYLCLKWYLGKMVSGRWILKRFVLANIMSATVGLIIHVTTRYYPSGNTEQNLNTLVMAVSVAFILTVCIELTVFLWASKPVKARQIIRGVLMGNVLSYSVLVAIHLLFIV